MTNNVKMLLSLPPSVARLIRKSADKAKGETYSEVVAAAVKKCLKPAKRKKV